LIAIQLVNTLFYVLQLLILVRVLFSWVDPNPYPTNTLKRVLFQLTDPLLEPIRRVVPPVAGALDFSPMIALLVLYMLQRFLMRLIVP
jgi:YggT family protein